MCTAPSVRTTGLSMAVILARTKGLVHGSASSAAQGIASVVVGPLLSPTGSLLLPTVRQHRVVLWHPQVDAGWYTYAIKTTTTSGVTSVTWNLVTSLSRDLRYYGQRHALGPLLHTEDGMALTPVLLSYAVIWSRQACLSWSGTPWLSSPDSSSSTPSSWSSKSRLPTNS